jgi:hypothetical protein
MEALNLAFGSPTSSSWTSRSHDSDFQDGLGLLGAYDLISRRNAICVTDDVYDGSNVQSNQNNENDQNDQNQNDQNQNDQNQNDQNQNDQNQNDQNQNDQNQNDQNQNDQNDQDPDDQNNDNDENNQHDGINIPNALVDIFHAQGVRIHPNICVVCRLHTNNLIQNSCDNECGYYCCDNCAGRWVAQRLSDSYPYCMVCGSIHAINQLPNVVSDFGFIIAVQFMMRHNIIDIYNLSQAFTDYMNFRRIGMDDLINF